MLLSLDWLREHLQKSDVKIKPDWLAERLTMRGLAVDKITHSSNSLDHVLVGQIEKIEKHPNADKLQITQTRISDDPQVPPLQIVCGAKNIAEGDKVPVATIGAVLPGNFVIKESKIRGVESFGMLCSGGELNIDDDSDGILKLPKNSHLGDQVGKLIGRKEDTVLEFDLTPNRGDCLGIVGLAREIAPLLKTRVREMKAPKFRITPHRTSSIVELKVPDPTLCPRYVARVIDNLKVGESPDWIKERLESVGINPINNIVDITNFVMIETGQPLHAFDLRKLDSGSLIVTQAKCAMDFTLLGDKTIELCEGDILIQDGERPVALAGIMGGANSQVTDDTTSIVLESAIFPSEQIRKTAKRLGLSTDASKRFERGTDIDMVAKASERAASLLRECCDANVYHPPIDTNSTFEKGRSLNMDMREIRSLAGIWNLSTEKAAELLESIGFETVKKSPHVLSVMVPTYRNDIVQSIDLIEELARLVGYEAVPLKYPISDACYDNYNEQGYQIAHLSRKTLAGLGLSETIHYSFTSKQIFKKYGLDTQEMIALLNPISEEFEVMRTDLLPSLLEGYDYNQNRKASNQRTFEIARIYHKDEHSKTTAREDLHVAVLLAGEKAKSEWDKNAQSIDFFTAKGLLERLVVETSVARIDFESSKENHLFHPAKSANVLLNGKKIGSLGEIHPFITRDVLKTKEVLVGFELSLEALKKFERRKIRFKNISKFPSVEKDLSIVVDKSTTFEALAQTAREASSDLLKECRVFDVYEGDNIPMGKKSLAFHLEFQSMERTLKDEEVSEQFQLICDALAKKHEAVLRA